MVSQSIIMSLLGYGLMIVIAGLSALLIRGIVATLARAQEARKRTVATPVTVSAVPERDETASHVAAIAAAVYAVLGARRIIHIGEARRGAAWATLARTQLQTSHLPRHDRR
jgi:hypothetical protein